MEHALNMKDPEDQEVAAGHLISLMEAGKMKVDPVRKTRLALIDKAETLSCKLENLLETDFLSNLDERDQAKAKHRFVAQCKQLEAKLNVLLTAVENFQLHSY